MDAELRRAERLGDQTRVFGQRYRCRLPMPLYTLPGESCHAPSFEDASAEVVAGLASYVGAEVARDLAPEAALCEVVTGRNAPRGRGRARSVTVDSLPLDHWLEGLRQRADPLPPVAVEVECKNPHHVVNWGPGASPCEQCDNTYTLKVETPGGYYVSVLVGWAAARGVLACWEGDNANRYHVESCPWARTTPLGHPDSYVLTGEPFCTCLGDNRDLRPRRILEATEAWLICPCPERAETWSRAFGPWGGQPWPPQGDPGQVLLACARLTSEVQVRTEVQRALRGLVGLGGR